MGNFQLTLDFIEEGSKPNHYLNVVNASAGSGKTYTLVKTYIKLLLTDVGENAEHKYSEILAMTFTNKAALEMKTRILKALEDLAYPEQKPAYLKEISGDLGLKSEIVTSKAKKLLSGILHNYEEFNVLTIDKFNLRLIRSFSRDLDLPPDFEVILNETPVIEHVVDGIMEEIGKNDKISDLLLHYAEANIEHEKSWNLRRSLIEFGSVLSSERDIPYVNRLMTMSFSVEDFRKTKEKLNHLAQQYKDLCAEANEYLFQVGPNVNIKNRSGIEKRLKKPNITDKEFLLTPTMLNNIDEAAHDVTVEPFYTKILQLQTWYVVFNEEAKKIELHLKNYFNMALLRYMNEELMALNKSERLIRISEFNTKIAKLLQEDTLYIYEKLGTRFRHFMLDEFQDTSRLQWMNLVPLIRESLGNGQENFIVGDPKQAIYRFKNGVAEQFVALPKVYNPEKDPRIAEISSYFNQMGHVQELENNWRSASEIVSFNNTLFSQLKGFLRDESREFYKSVNQIPTSKKEGYIYFDSKHVKDEENEDVNEERLKFVLRAVKDAIDDGYKPGDICILGRGNWLCNFIATELTNNNYSVVSADSLNIDSELTVRFIISYFRLRLNPVNQNTIRQFLHSYCELFGHPLNYYNAFFKVIELEENRTMKEADLNLFFEVNPQVKEQFFNPFESLYDLIQKTIRLFELQELKNPYLHHLADLVHLFESKNGPDLNLFLQEYDSMPKDSKALQVPESENALKVMTIHKSKGLEFPVVIVINDMKVSARGEFFVETEDYLLRNQLSMTSPVKEIREMQDEELEKSYLDTLNLYYVAYTRPVSRLYVKNDYSDNGLGAQIHTVLNGLIEPENQGEKLIFTSGKKVPLTAVHTKNEDQYFVPESASDNLWFPDIALQDTEELNTEDFLSDEQRYGNQFHLAISSIHDKNEIDIVVRRLIQSGEVEQEFEKQLKKDLVQLFSTSTYTQLFEGATGILSEQNYLISKNEQIRPDIVIQKPNQTIILDYKTGQQSKKHERQVRMYCNILREMNYPAVEAYLFYTKTFELVKVA